MCSGGIHVALTYLVFYTLRDNDLKVGMWLLHDELQIEFESQAEIAIPVRVMAPCTCIFFRFLQFSGLFFEMLGDNGLKVGMWLVHDELRIEFELRAEILIPVSVMAP